MMTAAGARIMTGLLTAELKAGRIRIEGDRIYRGKQQVEPRLSFVRADDQPATPTAAPGAPRSAGQRHRESELAYLCSRRFLQTGWSQPRKRLRTTRAWPSSSTGRLNCSGSIKRRRRGLGGPKISRPCHPTF